MSKATTLKVLQKMLQSHLQKVFQNRLKRREKNVWERLHEASNSKQESKVFNISEKKSKPCSVKRRGKSAPKSANKDYGKARKKWRLNKHEEAMIQKR